MSATATLSSKYQISITKGKGVLVMPVPELEQLAGLAAGADAESHRDHQDRF